MSFQKSISNIASVMQVPLAWSPKSLSISGLRKVSYAPLPDLSIDFTVRAEKVSYFEQTGVVFHILGNLWALVSYYEKKGTTMLFLIDQSKMQAIEGADEHTIPSKLLHSKFSLQESVDILRPAIVNSFISTLGKWSKLDLPK